ncbi:flagellar protein FlgN [Niallia sp. Krafla_26]|uniref:flagellar protein FlgN n=1 Tax=Niallia sp. Krafla_26 TaxID=3064703 RepID=UPI003D17EED3
MELSAQALITVMEKLLKLHQSLLGLSKEKTAILKNGDFDAFQEYLRNEQKHINAITILEKERQKAVSSIIPEESEWTLTNCLPQLYDADQEKLLSIKQELTDLIKQLKEVNELNQQLVQQSLQFVNLQLDLLLPDELDNYSKEQNDQDSLPKTSIFDSKA